MIEEILPGNRTRLNILRTIYENPDINITSLIKKVNASPNLLLDYINKLSYLEIIKETKIGGKKKVHIKNIKPNIKGSIGKLIYSLVEIDKKLLFFEKYKKLKNYFLQLNDIIDDKVDFIVIYGSYARFSATKDSDIDLLIVGNLNKERIKRIREIFVSLNIDLSLKIETINKFLKNKDKPLYRNIFVEHIIIYGEMKFITFL